MSDESNAKKKKVLEYYYQLIEIGMKDPGNKVRKKIDVANEQELHEWLKHLESTFYYQCAVLKNTGHP